MSQERIPSTSQAIPSELKEIIDNIDPASYPGEFRVDSEGNPIAEEQQKEKFEKVVVGIYTQFLGNHQDDEMIRMAINSIKELFGHE